MFAAIVWVFALLALYTAFRRLGMTPLMLAEYVYMFVHASWYGPVIYMCLYMFRSLFFLPATLITVLSGVMFGPLLGPLYTWVGENISAQLSYAVGRFFRGYAEGTEGRHTLLATLDGRSAFMGVLLGRFMFLPFDLFNYAAGFARVEWRGYTLGTMLGIIPGMLAFVLAGAALSPADFFATGHVSLRWDIVVSSVLLIVFSVIVAKVVKR
jgi:uncharacterized membrane protein YdjX (TVP38/TMEM64 family)